MVSGVSVSMGTRGKLIRSLGGVVGHDDGRAHERGEEDNPQHLVVYIIKLIMIMTLASELATTDPSRIAIYDASVVNITMPVAKIIAFQLKYRNYNPSLCL